MQQNNIEPENLPPENGPLPVETPGIIPPGIEPPQPRQLVWEGWPTVAFGVAIFVVYSIVQTLVVVGFLMVAIIGARISNPDFDIPRYLIGLSTNGLLLSVAIVVSAIAGIGFIILFIKLRRGFSVKEYLALKSISLKTVSILLGIILALILVSTFLEPYIGKNQNSQFAVNAYESAVWPAFFWVATVIFAPAFEESFFRGFLFAGLKRSHLGAAGTIILTAATWAALHALQYNFYGVASIFVLGIVFGTVRLKSGTLWSTLILHGVWNLAAMIGTVLYIHGIGR